MSYAQGYQSFDPYGGLTEEEEQAEGPYWLRHWRGQLPLAQSYWVNGFIVNLSIAFGQAVLLGLAESRQLRLVAWAFVIFVVTSIVLRVWSFVGIWRSAGRHADRGGSEIWAWIARAMIGLAVLSFLATAPQLWSQVREMGLIAIGRDSIGTPASLKLSPDGREITLDGNITAGVGADFRKALEAAPNVQRLILNSHGGRIVEALVLVDEIKARKLDTRVIEDCESACTLLFLAGAERSASQLARIGFHQPDFPGLNASERAEIISDNSRDYRAAGISEEFIQRIMATPPERMWYPTGDEMTEAGVLNAIVVSRKPSARETDRLGQVLQQAAANINSRRGTMVDKITRLEGAHMLDGMVVVDFLLTEPLTASRTHFARVMMPILEKQVCEGPDRAMIGAGGKYRFDYRYEDGSSAGTVMVGRC